MRPIRIVPILLIAAACAPRTVPSASAPPESAPVIHATSTGMEVRLQTGEQGVSSPIEAPPALVFDALISVMTDFEIEPDILESRVRRYGATRITRSRMAGEATNTLLRCGNQGAGPSAVARLRIRLSVVSQVDAADDGSSLLTTRVEGTATPVDGTSTSMVNCTSTGKLEERIARGVGMVVAARQPRG